MAGKIFINYRRDDSIGMAGRLHDRLAQTFGRDKLFMDVDHIPAGEDFVAHLNKQVAECDVVLVVIGPNWLKAKDKAGQRRLHQPDDFVAIEIAAALARNIRVIPVLVDRARMPKESELPDSLKPLARRQAVEVRHAYFGRDAEALITRMREAVPALLDMSASVPESNGGSIAPRPWRRTVAGAAAVAVLLLIGWLGYSWISPTSTYTIDLSEIMKLVGEQAPSEAEAKRKADETERQRLADLKVEQERQAKAVAEADAKRKADEAERQRLADLKVEQERQAKAVAEADAKRKADEAERQRLADLKVEQERQAKAVAEADAKRKADEAERQRLADLKVEQERQARAAAEAEAKRKAEASTPPRLTKADVVKLFARFRLILERVRTDYVEPPDEQKLLLGAIQGMQNAWPSALLISNAGIASTARNVGGTIDIDAIYDTALSILNARTTQNDEAGLAEAATKGLLTALDPHSSYMDPKSFRDMQVQTHGEFGGIGIEVTMERGLIKVVAPIDDMPGAKAGVRAGDLITHLNGDQVEGLTLNQAVEKMRGPVGTNIRLTLQRTGLEKPIDLTIVRATIRVRAVRAQTEGDDVGYIRLTQFNEQTTEGLKKAITDISAKISDDKLKGYVLDLRNNPGGLLDQAISVSDAFLQKGEIVSTRGRNAEETQRFNARPGDITNGRPIIVLINGGTAAASEILAGALQDHKRATIIGTRSFGKGTVQTIIPLGSGNGALRLTTARYFTPSGRSIQAKGISPDIEVLQDVPDELKTKTDTKGEASLRGHLKGDEGKEQTGSQSYIPPDAKNDKALNMALDLLRGTQVNSAFPPKTAVPN